MTDNLDIAQHESKSNDLLSQVVAAHGSGEERPQQREMVQIVTDAIQKREHAVVQAGTGVGKSIGYLVPILESGKRSVISTATKQLSEQLSNDIPFLNDVLHNAGHDKVNVVTLKGRANYVCLRKIADLKRLNAQDGTAADKEANDDETSLVPLSSLGLSSKVEAARAKSADVNKVFTFLENIPVRYDGDRTNTPVVSDAAWADVSSTTAECIGKKACPFAEECFSEIARSKANAAQVVITNHALTATELNSEEGMQTFGPREVIVFDEAHELDRYLSEAWGTRITPKSIIDAAKACKKALPAHLGSAREAADEIQDQGETLKNLLMTYEEDTMFSHDEHIDISKLLREITLSCAEVSPALLKSDPKDAKVALAFNLVMDLLQSIAIMLRNDHEIVQWIEFGKDEKTALRAAPLRVGPQLIESLERNEATMIVTSATITVGGSFDIPKRNLALDETARNSTLVDVGTPFDYQKQGILYIPEQDTVPAPVGRDRQEHTQAVLTDIVDFVKAAGGRTLVLSTTTEGARRMAETLRAQVDTPIISQFDGPAGLISKKFMEDETSTLCATMGMWHGLNIPGKSLICVYIDKIPFANSNDPLLKARMDDVNSRGGNGFMEVYAAQASNMLAQGVGRLIRSMSDRGVVVIADSRLKTKAYGRKLVKDLPEMWQTDDREVALSALKRIADL